MRSSHAFIMALLPLGAAGCASLMGPIEEGVAVESGGNRVAESSNETAVRDKPAQPSVGPAQEVWVPVSPSSPNASSEAQKRWALVPIEGAAIGGMVGLGAGIVVGQGFSYFQWVGAKNECLNQYTADDIRGMVDNYRGQSRYCEDYATRDSQVRYTRAFYPVFGMTVGMAFGMHLEHSTEFPEEPGAGLALSLALATALADRGAVELWDNKPSMNAGALLLALAGPFIGYYSAEAVRSAFDFGPDEPPGVLVVPTLNPSTDAGQPEQAGLSISVSF